MSLVVFPFKEEDLDVIAANLATAATHERVTEVWAVAAGEGDMLDGVAGIGAGLSQSVGTPVNVFAQERIGRLRPGKGDGMNTALRRAAATGFERVHFYDADIINFDNMWIDGAEEAADKGYDIVRHRFPRASTDAMITWMVTRPSLALTFPGTVLPRLGQPLGGELLLTAPAVEALAHDAFVADRSDWGIDTVLTYATSTMGLALYEHNLKSGKRHALYGSLDELRTMVVECLDAVASLQERPYPDASSVVGSDPPAPVPGDLKHTVAYDVNATIGLLVRGWTAAEADLALKLPGDLGKQLLRNRTAPHFAFMDAGAWGEVLSFLLDRFSLDDTTWRNLAFRLWLTRVLAYTTDQALAGYDVATGYLEGTIRDYEKAASEDVSP